VSVGDFSDGEGVGGCVGSVEVVVDIFEGNLKVARSCGRRVGIEIYNQIFNCFWKILIIGKRWMGRNEGKVDLK
jgi:hypothetical protein